MQFDAAPHGLGLCGMGHSSGTSFRNLSSLLECFSAASCCVPDFPRQTMEESWTEVVKVPLQLFLVVVRPR